MHQEVSDDVMMTSRDISEKHTSQNAINMKLGQLVLDEKNIRMSMHQQVSDDVMMTSRDISEKHTSQNAIKYETWSVGTRWKK